MITYDPNKPLISIHIPKTGGVSFRSILKLWFGQKLFFHYFDEKRDHMPDRHLLAPGICIHGHFNSKRQFGVHHYYPEVRQFITFLRDPFDILVSRYFFVKQQEKNNKAYWNGQKLTLPDNVNQYLEQEIIKKDYHPNILDFFPQQLTLGNFKNRINEQFIHIGVMEDFQGSINKLADLLGFSRPSVPKENFSERFEQVDYGLRELFQKNYRLENEIYQYALSIQ
jgi:hypothetical protein